MFYSIIIGDVRGTNQWYFFDNDGTVNVKGYGFEVKNLPCDIISNYRFDYKITINDSISISV